MKVCLACGKKFQSASWECPSCHQRPGSSSGYLTFSPELAEGDGGKGVDRSTHLAKFGDKNFWFRSRNRLILWALQKYFPNAKNFLEIGCGAGFVLSGIEARFPSLSLFGSDVLSSGLRFASRRVTRAELYQMDARRIPFDDEFQVIGAFDLIEHVEDDGLVLGEMYRACKSGGGIMITVPQHPLIWSQVDESAHHQRRYTRKELIRRVESANFDVIRVTSFVSLLFPLMFLSRVMKQVTRPYSRWDEFAITRLLNRGLESVLHLERFLIRLGVTFPAGGSLLLVARKR